MQLLREVEEEVLIHIETEQRTCGLSFLTRETQGMTTEMSDALSAEEVADENRVARSVVFVLAVVRSLEAEAVTEAALDSGAVAVEVVEQPVLLRLEALSRIYRPTQT